MTLLLLFSGADFEPVVVVETKGTAAIGDASIYSAAPSDQSIYSAAASETSIYGANVGDT